MGGRGEGRGRGMCDSGGAGRCWRRVERGCDDVAAAASGSRCAVGGGVMVSLQPVAAGRSNQTKP